MKQITPDTCVVRSDDCLATDLDGETILMSIERGSYYGLEATSRRIWELIEAPIRVSALCRQLAEEYEVDDEACAGDVLAFLNELLEEELLVVAEV